MQAKCHSTSVWIEKSRVIFMEEERSNLLEMDKSDLITIPSTHQALLE